MAYSVPQLPGGLYHATQRGHRGAPLFRVEADRRDFLGLLGREVQRRRWDLYAYCQMGNHVHLFLRTPEADLSSGMARLTGAFATRFNDRHRCRGTPFQGRYHAFVVEDEVYFTNVARYVVLNPVKAGLVDTPGEWRWSSYRATAGLEAAPRWLNVTRVLAQFGGDPAAYREFVSAGMGDNIVDWHPAGRTFPLGWPKEGRDPKSSLWDWDPP